MASSDQIKLFHQIKTFANELVTEWIAVIYKCEGREIFGKFPLMQLTEDIATKHLNECAKQLSQFPNNTDEFLAEKFDKLICIDPTYHPLELLFLVAQLAMQTIISLEIDFTKSATYEKDMLAVTKQIAEFLDQFDENAAALNGGNPQFDKSREYIFRFKIE